MSRLARVIPHGFVVVSLVLFAWAAVLWLAATLRETGEEVVRIDEPAKAFGEAKAGREFNISFTFKNPSNGPIHVVGSGGFCSRSGCLETEGLPLDIPANESRDVQLRVKAGSPGVFHGSIALYVTGFRGYRQITLEVSGRVVQLGLLGRSSQSRRAS